MSGSGMKVNRARDIAIRALDALHSTGEDQTDAYWVGYLRSALETVIFELRTGE